PAAIGPPSVDTCFRRTAAAPPPARPSRRRRARPNTSRCGKTCFSLPMWKSSSAGVLPTPSAVPRALVRLFLRRGDDRSAILELDLRRLVGAAFGATVQRIDGDNDLVTGLQALGGQAGARLYARCAAFENPVLLNPILALDCQDQNGVGTDEPEFLHCP